MADVFISYHKKSMGELAKQIADELENAGISCWYMGRDSTHGRYGGQITKAIRECTVFLLILNEKSNNSKNVLSEVNIAFRYEKEILPFHVDDCELSDDLLYHLSAFTTIEANLPDKQCIRKLVREIAGILGKEAPPEMPELTTPFLQTYSKWLLSCMRTYAYNPLSNSADVFIGYRKSDKMSALVRDIVGELESKKISCWYALRNAQSGAFADSILAAIGNCKVFLLMLDEGANGPGYVYNELLEALALYASEEQPRIIPFKVGDFSINRKLYFYLRPFHITNGGDSLNNVNTDELIQKISDALNKTPETRSPEK